MTSVPVIGVEEIDAALDRRGAVDAIASALRDGVDIEADPPRLFSPLDSGEFLLMPTQSPEHARDLAEWQTGAQPVTNLRELVAGAFVRREARPAVYTGVGMSWEDLAVVAQILRSAPSADASPQRGNTDVRN